MIFYYRQSAKLLTAGLFTKGNNEICYYKRPNCDKDYSYEYRSYFQCYD